MAKYSVITFEAWLELIFQHSVSPNRSDDWYMADVFRYWQAHELRYRYDPKLIAEFVCKLFSNPRQLVDKYSLKQISQGLDYLISYSGFYSVIRHDQVSYAAKIKIIQSTYTVFSELFAAKEWRKFGNEEYTCFMWFDIACYNEKLDLELLQLLKKILQIPFKNCQYSALHGLGERIYDIAENRIRGIFEDSWTPEEEQLDLQEKKAANQKWIAVINEFLKEHPNLDKKMKQFAERAKRGKV